MKNYKYYFLDYFEPSVFGSEVNEKIANRFNLLLSCDEEIEELWKNNPTTHKDEIRRQVYERRIVNPKNLKQYPMITEECYPMPCNGMSLIGGIKLYRPKKEDILDKIPEFNDASQLRDYCLLEGISIEEYSRRLRSQIINKTADKISDKLMDIVKKSFKETKEKMEQKQRTFKHKKTGDIWTQKNDDNYWVRLNDTTPVFDLPFKYIEGSNDWEEIPLGEKGQSNEPNKSMMGESKPKLRTFKHKKSGSIATQMVNTHYHITGSITYPNLELHKSFIEDTTDWEEVIEEPKLTYEKIRASIIQGPNSMFEIKISSPIDKTCSLPGNMKILDSIVALIKLTNVAIYLNEGWKHTPNDKTIPAYYFCLNIDELVIYEHDAYNEGNVFFKTEKLAQQALDILGEDCIRLALTRY